MYEIVMSDGAKKRLNKLPRHIANDIVKKIEWLAENADAIDHERLRGRGENSLHCGQYRIPYFRDVKNRVIYVEDIDKHDEAYRRLERRGFVMAF
ncbi:MAG: type II toxin-antitoxin system RelE/ParE family toxin [Anaerolineae bacterium]